MHIAHEIAICTVVGCRKKYFMMHNPSLDVDQIETIPGAQEIVTATVDRLCNSDFSYHFYCIANFETFEIEYEDKQKLN